MGTGGIVTLVATLVVGGAVGTASMIGLVSSQTSAPDDSPASVENVVIEYGS